ncbi:MAG: molybdopterin cofactor-binding domain-containing protein, partial [bacterium]
MSKKVKFTVGMEGMIVEREAEIPDDEPQVIGVDGKDLDVIGARTPRLDAHAKVTGRAKYTYDINRPGMLHAKFLRCPYPAATIVSMDVSKAQALPGVKAVETFKDKVIRFAGEAVAAVAAESREICDDALALIEVKYEKKPFVVDKEIARRPGAPLVHEGSNSSSRDSGKPRAEVQAALEKSDKIFGDTYRTQVQTHSALETHGAVAEWDGDNLTVWTSTQGTFGVRKDLADAFNLKESQVRVITEHMGGGFGAKFGAGEWSVTAARLAKKANAPVKLMLDREGEHLCTGNRPDSIQTLRAGADKSGKLTALDVSTIGTPGIGGGGAGTSVPMVYHFPVFSKTEENVQINAGPAAAMRAPGHPQGSFALEQLMDSLAEEVGMDPVEFRKKNDPHPVRQKEYDIDAKEIGWT